MVKLTSQPKTIRQIEALQERAELLKAFRSHYQPHPMQERIHAAFRSGKVGVFARCGRQSGKTMSACELAWLTAQFSPGSVISIITPERKQAYKIYWKKGKLQKFGPSSWIKRVDNEHLTIYFHNGSYIELDGSDNIDSHRGDTKDLVILDEFKDIHPDFFEEVVEPMLLTTDGKVLIIGTPPKTPESHYSKREEACKADPDWEVIHWTSYDSPYTNKKKLDKKKATLVALGMEDTFKREYLAEYTVGGKDSVFPMFSRSFHMRHDIETLHRYFHTRKSRLELYWVSDPATSSTFAALLIAYWREKGQIIVLDEIYEKDKNKTHVEAIVNQAMAKMAPFEPIVSNWQAVYDDAEPWFAQQLLHGHGINSYPAGKQSVEKEEGIALMKTFFLAKNAVVVSQLCQNFAKELENYIMIVKGDQVVYPKINDHLIDCFRYFLTFSHAILAVGDSELDEDAEVYYDFILERQYEDLGLPTYIQ